jgi:hypothetical protein
MPKLLINKKGIVLYMVLVSILAALVLASSILNIILSQSSFSHHEASRVQAYYAALAGANYALERLRSGNEPSCWSTSGTYTRKICRSGGTCTDPCDPIDDTLPRIISQITIDVGGTGPGGTLKISSKATYTYTPP